VHTVLEHKTTRKSPVENLLRLFLLSGLPVHRSSLGAKDCPIDQEIIPPCTDPPHLYESTILRVPADLRPLKVAAREGRS